MDDEEENGGEDLEVDSDHIYTHLGVHIWLVHKSEPMWAGMRVRYEMDDLPDDKQEMVESYASILIGKLKDTDTTLLAMTDERESVTIIRLDQVQAFQVIAPDKLPPELTKDTE